MKRSHSAFTLVELLVTVSIIGMLIMLGSPMIDRALRKAEGATCLANMRVIGQAVLQYTQDHDNHYPVIEGFPSSPIYATTGEDAGTLIEVLGPYGVDSRTLRCPSDIKEKNYFTKEGSSYMWRPMVDDELVSAPRIYRRGREFVPPPHRIRLLTDFEPVRGHFNVLLGDGRVRTY